MIMKKLLLLLSALMAMCLVFISCEKDNLDDPTIYCWEVHLTQNLMGLEMAYDIDMPMTNREAKELRDKGTYSMNGMTVKVVRVEKQDKDDCGLQ